MIPLKRLAFCFLFASILAACSSSDDDSAGNSSEDSNLGSDIVVESPLRINEVVADAVDGGDDWIELYVVEGSLTLSDYSITDDKEGREPQSLPDVTLTAGEYIVILAIDEEDTAPDDGHFVTFKLGGDDAVYLYKDGSLVDELDWLEGDAAEGFSFGLLNGDEPTATTLLPSPGAENIAYDGQILSDVILNHDAQLRINEIVAKAEDGESDWIELYVTGTGTINLSDYTLTDENLEIAVLPELVLSAGDYVQIFATSDEVDGRYSVPFKLSSSEVVNLYLGDDLVDQLAWKKGQALIGDSFGRYPDGSDNTQTLAPSPAASNAMATHTGLIITEVVAKAANDGADWFELYNATDNTIALAGYQVIDSSDDIDPVDLPDIELLSGEYIVIYATDEDPGAHYVPFGLGKTDELNLEFDGETVDYIDWQDSDAPEGFSYGLTLSDDHEYQWQKTTLSPTLGSENTALVVFNQSLVTDLYFDISTENWQDILANPLDEEYHETSVTYKGVTLDSVAIRTKGASSLSSVAQSSSDRYSFKIDINEYVDDQKLFGLKKFTLQNGFNDPSYMREFLAYELMEKMGVPAPRRAYVNVYINNELFGLYLMVEAVDGEFLEDHFTNANGDMYKPDGTGSDLLWIDNNIESYSGINPQRNEDTTDHGAFLDLVWALDSGATDVIDVDGLLRYMAVSVSLSNLDSYHGTLAHNYYLYEQDGVFSLLPWDFNESFGTFSMGCRSDIRGLYIDEPTDFALADRPLVANVFANQAFLDVYHDYLWQLLDGPLEADTFSQRVAEIASVIRDHVANDPSAFYSVSQFEQNLTSTVSRFYGLTSFINSRTANIKQQLNGDIPSSGNGNGYCR